MSKTHQGLGIYAIIVFIAFLIGSYILVATFFGIVTLIGLIALVESIPLLKWFVRKTSSLVDILLFTLTIIAVTAYGLNISAALTMAGLGFTLIYAPYIREQHHIKKYGKAKNASIKPNDNCNRS